MVKRLFIILLLSTTIVDTSVRIFHSQDWETVEVNESSEESRDQDKEKYDELEKDKIVFQNNSFHEARLTIRNETPPHLHLDYLMYLAIPTPPPEVV